MINPLELTKRQIIVLSTGMVAVGIAGLLTVGMVMAEQLQNSKVTYSDNHSTPNDTVNVTKTPASIAAGNDAADAPQKATPAAQTQPAAGVAQSKPVTVPAPAQANAGVVSGTVETVTGVVNDTAGRLEYTTKKVIPGDPLSYIGTYGQCPFYENAGEKGCWPPSDIICNADWSICSPR